MVTMKEALANVDRNKCNSFQQEFYDDKMDKDWNVSPKQMTAIINKMPKLDGQEAVAPAVEEKVPDNATEFNHGNNISGLQRYMDLVNTGFGEIDNYEHLSALDQENKRAICVGAAIQQMREDYFNRRNGG